MQQLFERVYLLEGEVGGRPLQLVYLKGAKASMLLDTGCAHDPARFIAPQMREAGGDPGALTWILNTHGDLDHTGGNRQMKEIAPGALVACGDADRCAVAGGLPGLMRCRYDVFRQDHQIFYEGETLAWLQREGGEPVPVDVTFRGGEHIELGDGWVVEVLSVPGHSAGHLAIHDPANRALYGGDAIHGAVYLGLDGTPKLCPTYEDVAAYLDTIRRIEQMPVTTYVGCHWPVKRGAEIAAFCRESREFVERVQAVLEELLASPRTLRQLCMDAGPRLGDWPRDVDVELVYAIHGHLERMQMQGRAQAWMRAAEPRVLEYVRARGCTTSA